MTRLWPNPRLVTQTGTNVEATSGATITFPIPFRQLVSVSVANGDAGAQPNMIVALVGFSATGFGYKTNVAGAERVNWIASGYL